MLLSVNKQDKISHFLIQYIILYTTDFPSSRCFTVVQACVLLRGRNLTSDFAIDLQFYLEEAKGTVNYQGYISQEGVDKL